MRGSIFLAACFSMLAAANVALRPQQQQQHLKQWRVMRGGATETEALAPETEKKKASQVLDGGTSAASLQDQLTTIFKRVLRLARRVYSRIVGADVESAPSASSEKKTASQEPKEAAAAEEKAPPPAPVRRRAPTTAASRKAARISRELAEFQRSPPEGCKLTLGKNLNVWIITLTGSPGTIFEGEKYKLRVAFPPDYPASPPSVYFLQPTPRHPHVYTNGDICLSLLGEGWSPNLTVPKLALSILSMLSSAKHKGVPQDNSNHAGNQPGKKQEGWM